MGRKRAYIENKDTDGNPIVNLNGIKIKEDAKTGILYYYDEDTKTWKVVEEK